jgi:hypothetical protein
LGVVASSYSVPPFAATGGTVSDSGGYRYHTFTANGTFSVTSGNKNVEYFAIGGGGGAGSGTALNAGGAYYYNSYGGGGGAGGVHISSMASLSAGVCNIVIGAGGVGGQQPPSANGVGFDGSSGSSTTLSGIITHTLSGGGGGKGTSQPPELQLGGQPYYFSGNGGSNVNYSGANGAPSYPFTPGTPGGTGGGGAGTAGNATDINGGAAVSVFSNSYGAGGNGGIYLLTDYTHLRVTGANAAANTGRGGVGGTYDKGGNGGSGIVVFRYLI